MGLLDDIVNSAEQIGSDIEHAIGSTINASAQLVSGGLSSVGLHAAATDVSTWGERTADSMGASVAEQQLGQTTDPTELIHGDVTALNNTVQQLGKFATGFAETARGLSAVDTSHWIGDAGDAFRAKFTPQPQQWHNAYQANSTAAAALDDYAQTVQWAQGQAQQAINLYARGQQATQQAQTAYQQQVEAYNSAAQSYNAEAAAGGDPGPAPTEPGPFTDPGAADRQQAQQILDQARQKRDSAGAQAASAMRSATDLAPTEPSFATRMLDDASDMIEGGAIGAEHFVGGIVKGAAGIVDFVRSINPMDPYNLTHPSEYVDGLSSTAAGLVHLALHPSQLVPALVGSGWSSDPFEAAGNLVPNLALIALTDGAGAAEDAAGTLGEDAVETGARDLAGAAEDTVRGTAETICADDPVDVATGAVLLPQVDVDLAGMLPLTVRRAHLSRYRLGGWFGPSWASTVDQRVIVDDSGVLFVGDDGVVLHYPHPADGARVLPELGARTPLTATAGGGYTVTEPNTGRTLHFARRPGARSWPIVAITDPIGHRITFRYDDSGAPVEIAHDGGYRIRITTADRRITALHLVTAEGDVELVSYGYVAGNLTEVTNSSGLPTVFEYDSATRLTGWTDRNGVWYRYDYDGLGRCVRTRSRDDAFTGTFDYDDEQRVTLHTDGSGAVVRYEYDELRHVTSIADPLGNVTRTDVDSAGNLRARTDPLGRVTRWEYDEQGNPLRVTRPDGTQALVEYDEHARPTVVVGPDGAVWRYGYDDRGQRTELVDPLGGVTRLRYDERGHIAATTDPTGRTTTIATNAAGLPIAVTDGRGGVLRWQRDDFGRVVAQVDATGAITRYGWTVEGRPAWRADPDGATQRWRYDGEGNEIEHTDATGRVTRTEYTGFDLRSAIVGPDDSRLEYRYDERLRLAAVTDQQGLVWRYEYDAAGRLIAETDFDGRVQRYARDAAGQLVARVNGLGQAVHYRYDELGNVVEQRSGAGTTRFEHDPAGRLVAAVNGDCALSITRDALGRIVAETTDGRTLSIAYDAAGRRVRRETPGRVESRWEYDAAGNASALHSAGHTMAYAYDQAGREIARRLDKTFVLTQSWHATGLLAGQFVFGGGAGAAPTRLLQQRDYTYRADGALVRARDRLAGNRDFALDELGRVTAVAGAQGMERYHYDPAGNITSAVWPAATGAPEGDGIGRRGYTGTLINAAGKIQYRHDRQGRIVSRRQRRLSTKDWVWRYAWDDDDRLVGVVTPDGAHWRYRYDPLGRRVAKQRMAPDQVTVAEQVDFTWDGGELVEQCHDNTRTVTWDYREGQHAPVTQIERTGTGGLPGPEQEWYDQRFCAIVTDLVGTPTELVDASGELVWHQAATLWGAPLGRTSGRAGTPLRFPGQYLDAETGLHYNHHRYYDPATGRYASHDPLGLLPAPNPVTYVPNPLGWADPLGLGPCNIRVSPAGQDWATKGAHLHIDGAEVRVYPDGAGGIGAEPIRLSNGNVATMKQAQQVIDALQSDPALRQDLIDKATSVRNDMNAGSYGMATNRAAEMNYLIAALKKVP